MLLLLLLLKLLIVPIGNILHHLKNLEACACKVLPGENRMASFFFMQALLLTLMSGRSSGLVHNDHLGVFKALEARTRPRVSGDLGLQAATRMTHQLASACIRQPYFPYILHLQPSAGLRGRESERIAAR